MYAGGVVRVLANVLRPTLVIATVLLFPTTGSSSTVLSVPLQRVTDIAGVAFSGTVDSMRTDMFSGRVVTLVHFSNLRFAKGARTGNTLTLKMAGGIYRGTFSGPVGQPKFEIGRRYVVLSDSSLGSLDDLFVPIVGLYQGFYPVRSDPVTGRSVVYDWRERPIVGISRGHLVVLDMKRVRPGGTVVGPEAAPPDTGREPAMELRFADQDPGSRVAELDFLNVIRGFASRK